MYMMLKNYYKILQVVPDACQEVIQAAFKALSKKIHPDKRSDRKDEATEAMAILNEAYEILSNPVKRHAYDRALFSGVSITESDGSGETAPQPEPRSWNTAESRELYPLYRSAVNAFNESFDYLNSKIFIHGGNKKYVFYPSREELLEARRLLIKAKKYLTELLYGYPNSIYEDDARTKLDRIEKLLESVRRDLEKNQNTIVEL